ncbi:HNH endonuclease signature motif containing protein [Micromonospora zhanjiangensis]
MLAEAAAQAHSVTEVMRLLGVRISGGSHAHISRRLRHLGIDTSHFTGNAHNRGRPGPRLTPPQLLIKLPPGSRRTPGHRLKRALRLIGLPEQCERCGVGSTWQGASLTLHVDHINGDFLDNRPRNLRFLCPNCHSQTATYAGSRRAASLVPDVIYDDEATTPTGIPLGRRLPSTAKRPAVRWPWRVRLYRFRSEVECGAQARQSANSRERL